jgi:N-acyl-L-homoserine lactone synthetase
MGTFRTDRVLGDEDLRAVGRLRYRIYVEEMKLVAPDHPWCADGVFLDPYDDYSDILVLRHDGEVVGTVRMTLATAGRMEIEDQRELGSVLGAREGVAEVTRLMVDRRYRCFEANRSLYYTLFGRMLALGVRHVLVAGKEGGLGRLYRNMGFTCIDPEWFTYDVVPGARYQLLRLDLGARRSLRRVGIRAFFAAAAHGYDLAPGLATGWLRKGLSRGRSGVDQERRARATAWGRLRLPRSVSL